MSKPVCEGTRADLEKHFQAACDVELWTIFLYLTALYSIRKDTSEIHLPQIPGRPTTTVAKLLVSVALQEMYHLQLAGNITAAFGFKPALNWPRYDQGIPYISHLPLGVEVKLGTATDSDIIKLLIAIETPDSHEGKIPLPGDPAVPSFPDIQYDADGRPSYRSIGDLYSVIEQLVSKLKQNEMSAAPLQIVNGLFKDWYPCADAITQANVAEAINIIVDQGEGAIGDQKAPIADPEAVDNENKLKHPYFNENKLSHVERFTLIKGHASHVTIWPVSGSGGADQQRNLNAILGTLLHNLRRGWSHGHPDLSSMFLVRAAFASVYESGVLPSFHDPDAAQLAAHYSAAVAAVAPLTGATWSKDIQYFFGYTDILGMKANGQDGKVMLDDQHSVFQHRNAVIGMLGGGVMPPGDLNRWSSAQVQSLKEWNGS